MKGLGLRRCLLALVVGVLGPAGRPDRTHYFQHRGRPAGRPVNGTVYAISTSRDTSPFLGELTRATGGRGLGIDRGVAPEGAFLEILDEFRRRYVITFAPAGVAPGGWHRVEVRVPRHRRARVQARPGYVSVTK